MRRRQISAERTRLEREKEATIPAQPISLENPDPVTPQIKKGRKRKK